MNKKSHSIARRMSQIKAFHVMDLLARARQLEAAGESIIHMEIGEPDFATPETIINAGIESLQQGKTHYTPATGLKSLKRAISEHYKKRFGVRINDERILITPGASGALQLAFGVSFDPGDRILMADPTYPCNRNFAYLLDAEPHGIEVGKETDYQLTAELVDKHWDDKTRGVMIASPSNPTGTVIEENALKEIIQLVTDRNGILIADEIYHELVYDMKPTTALSFSDDIFVINSFSKYYGMTGWRIGWLVAPDGFIRECDKLAQNIFLAAPTPAQFAATAAFSSETRAILEQRRWEFQQRRDYLLPELREIGFKIDVEPQGAFYIYADCSKFTRDSFAFCRGLLEHAGVAITPGIDFGHNAEEKHVRFAYTTSMINLKEGVKRLREHLD